MHRDVFFYRKVGQRGKEVHSTLIKPVVMNASLDHSDWGTSGFMVVLIT